MCKTFMSIRSLFGARGHAPIAHFRTIERQLTNLNTCLINVHPIPSKKPTLCAAPCSARDHEPHGDLCRDIHCWCQRSTGPSHVQQKVVLKFSGSKRLSPSLTSSGHPGSRTVRQRYNPFSGESRGKLTFSD